MSNSFTKKELDKATSLYFLGIGGIGNSALARLFKSEGKKVAGQDSSASRVTSELEKIGIKVTIGQDLKSIPKDFDVFIYSNALVDRDSDFLNAVKKIGKPVISYPQALGLVSEGKFTIAVSGTHGKTTTTAMITKLLVEAGLEPSAIIGSLLNEGGTNFVSGKSNYLVVEADEYKEAFLNLKPSILVITNIDADHLDYYKDLSGVQKAFSKLVASVPAKGYIIYRKLDKKVRPAVKNAKAKKIDYEEFISTKLKIALPGRHNLENAGCALAVAHILEIPKKKAVASLEQFSGTWRRFEYKGKTAEGAIVYDDYAHNPAKVRASIAGFKEKFPGKKLVVAFQPHLYSRTKLLLDEFSKSFNEADSVVIAPIFAAREPEDKEISSVILAEAIKNIHKGHLKKTTSVLPLELNQIPTYLKNVLDRDSIFVTMGAGDIYKVGEEIITRKK